ncbi:fumarylacetoacetate hydrolase [Paraburkholderia hospita]|uniref:Fumarylacetoacetate hydrolase n=1 Tax=Paraburkholderia hospita TaxID=169430 RepID=A0ABN0FCH6_9BURK|nr:fumarylacetoacetate hydrolase [Paraburkholderia hospita]
MIGRSTFGVSVKQAVDAIFGFTCLNQVDAVGCPGQGGPDSRIQHDHLPTSIVSVGPAIATANHRSSKQAFRITTAVGRLNRRFYSLDILTSSLADTISLLSREVALEAGDVIAYGPRFELGPLVGNMRAEVTIEGIGTLANSLAL